MGRTMLQDMVEHTEQLPIVDDKLSSPLIAQILEFQESELTYSETTLQNNSEASNCTTTTNTNINTNNIDLHTTNYSLLFDSTQDNDQNDMSGLSLEDFNDNTTDYYTVSNYLLDNNHQQNLQFGDCSTTLSNNIIPNNLVTDDDVSLFRYPNDLPLVPLHIGLNNEEECLSGMPSNYTRFSTTTTTSSTTDSTAIGPYLPDTTLVDYNPAASTGGGGYFFLGTDLLPQELDFLQQMGGDSGGGLILGSHTTLQNFYNCDHLQPINNSESQQLVNGVLANSTCLTPDQISGLEDPSFKVGKLTAEERREKIHRYMKKRNERNFTKKLKYACRKTLADSRPRVRGRFAKNDELEMHRITGNISNHEEDTDEDVIVKDEDDLMDSSSDILAHIGGVDFFKCNNPLQSWI